MVGFKRNGPCHGVAVEDGAALENAGGGCRPA